MRELNAREKNLGVIVTLVVMLGASSWVDRNLKRRNDALRAEVTAAQEQLRQAQVLLATPAPVSAAPVGAPASAAQTTAPTLTLLKDLTSPGESAGIRVVDVERTGDAGFRLSLEGPFPEMMHYLSYLERKDSRFKVGSAAFEKITSTGGTVLNAPGAVIRESGAPPARQVRGVFKVSYRN